MKISYSKIKNVSLANHWGYYYIVLWHKSYKERDVIQNTCKLVAEELDFIEDGM